MKAEDFNRLIQECWESIAFVAFDGFQTMGKGVVALLEDRLPLEKCYTVYKEGETDPRTTQLLAEYDPTCEVLVQYIQPEGAAVTLRIRPQAGQRHPWQVWMFNRTKDEKE